MSETGRLLWKYRTDNEVLTVAITADGQKIIAGSDDGHVYCFRRDGALLWRYKVAAGKVFRLALASETEHIAVGTLDGNYITLLDQEGQLVWQQRVGAQTWAGAAISSNGELVCGAADDGKVRLWNRDQALLWEYRCEHKFIRRVSTNLDGDAFAVGADDGHIYLLDQWGQLQWKYKTGGKVWSGAQISNDGEYIAAGSGDHHVYFLNRNGQLLWRYQTSDQITAITITPDAQYVAAGSQDDHIYLIDQSGHLLWKYRTGADVYGVAISSDGQFSVAASNDHFVYLFNASGEMLGRYEAQAEVYGVALSTNGRYFVAGSKDHHIYLFENLVAPEAAVAQSKRTDRSWWAIQRIRRAYTENPVLGLCRWFEVFDQQLQHNRFEVCEALLQEARNQNYPFTPQEWSYVDSREGALLLQRGIIHHQRNEYADAEIFYRRSKEIQQRVKHNTAQADIELAQHMLAQERHSGQRDPHLAQMLQEGLAALGKSESILRERLNGADFLESRAIIQAALQLRLAPPLMRAAESDNVYVRLMAIAVMARLIQIEEPALLLGLGQDGHWFTRWRAYEALRGQPTLKSSVQTLLFALEQEIDPEVRRTLALGLMETKDRQATLGLVAALSDSDPDVRRSVALALGQVGDRRALLPLQQVTDGKDFLGNSVREAAQHAIQAIKKRHPLPTVEDVALYRQVTGKSTLERATVFTRQESVFVTAVLIPASPQTQLKLQCIDSEGLVLFEQTSSYSRLQAETTALHSRLQQQRTDRSASPSLVEFIDSANGALDAIPPKSLLFKVPPPQGEWQFDQHTIALSIYDDSVTKYEQVSELNFQVIA